MGKMFKIMLACVGVVFFTAVIGFGIWKMADASSAANKGQHKCEKSISRFWSGSQCK